MLVIGHRGASAYEAENTLKSFQMAIDMGVDMVECDIYTLSSGETIIMHDEKVDRTTNSSGYIKDYSFDDIKKLVTANNESVPTLQELLDLVDKRCGVLIEIKVGDTAQSLTDIINHYVSEKGWDEDLFTVQSFNHVELKKFEELCPNIKTATLMAGLPLSYAEYTKDLKTSYANIHRTNATKEYIDDIHARGLQACVWAVTDIEQLNYLKEIGVDGVITDFPDLMRGALTDPA